MYCSSFERAFSCLTFSSFKILLFKKSFLFLAFLKVNCFLKVSHFGHVNFLVSLWEMTYLLSKSIKQKVKIQKWLTFQKQHLRPCRQAYFMEMCFSTMYDMLWPEKGMHLAYFWKYSISFFLLCQVQYNLINTLYDTKLWPNLKWNLHIISLWYQIHHEMWNGINSQAKWMLSQNELYFGVVAIWSLFCLFMLNGGLILFIFHAVMFHDNFFV